MGVRAKALAYDALVKNPPVCASPAVGWTSVVAALLAAAVAALK